jgi:dihydroflavonol-4-reductase
MKYLITGASGHVGKCLVDTLLKQKASIRVLVLPGEVYPYKGVEIIYGDVTKKETLIPFFANEDKEDLILIHLAAIISIYKKGNPRVRLVNVVGTQNVMDLALANHVKKIIHVSSVHALSEGDRDHLLKEQTIFYPERVNGQYAKSKAEANNYVMSLIQNGLPAIIVHPSGIIGPYDDGHSHLVALLKEYYNGKLTSIVKGGYDFVDVRDVVDGILKAIDKGRVGECYILSNRYYSIREIINIASKITGKKPIKRVLPSWFVKIFAPIAEIWYKIRKKTPLFTKYAISTINNKDRFSHEKANRELGYSNRNIEDTIKDSYDYLQRLTS